MGRKKLPENLKESRGTLQKCRQNGQINVDTIEIVQAPSYLKGGAKKIFIEKAKQLSALEILTPLDLEQLVIYAISMDAILDINNRINKEGRFIKQEDEKGEVCYIPNPLFKYYNKLYTDNVKIVLQIASQFGFTPSSRVSMMGIDNNNEKPQNDFVDYDEE